MSLVKCENSGLGGNVAGVLRFVDCLNRKVTLDDDTWREKILRDHAELDGNEMAIERTLADPDTRNRDKVHLNREVFYRAGVLPSPYHVDLLKVVVAFQGEGGDDIGRIVTAYATDRVARGEKRLWSRPH